MSLTDREREIVALLRRDPLIGSAAIADALGTTRAAVNVHLSNLGKKGVILGRGYVLSEQPSVVVIGGANMDVKARSNAAAVPATSNPGTGSMAAVGVEDGRVGAGRPGAPAYVLDVDAGARGRGEHLVAQAVAADRRDEVGAGAEAGEVLGDVAADAAGGHRAGAGVARRRDRGGVAPRLHVHVGAADD
ncbi:MAG: winged helix-turn-helix transcriptional regulator, partial [Actinomycetales bacterium]